MRYIAIKGLEQSCSQIVLGTSFFRPEMKDLVFEILDTYIAQGGNVLDTSRVYGVGQSERAIALWLKARNRKNVMLISKGCHHYVDQEGIHHPEQKRVRPEFITEDLKYSLENMGTDYFDMFLLHRDDPSVPVGELIDALEEHKQAGLIKTYGVSNWSTQRMDEAIAYANRKGYIGIALNSPSLSLAKVTENRWEGVVYADSKYINWHENTKLPLFSWAAQASGFFYYASRFKPEKFPNPDIARVYYSEENLERLKRATQLAKKIGNGIEATNVALAYVLNQSFPICAVIGPQKPLGVRSSIAAANIVLTEDERLWLNLQR
jgi:aryl-alcohol dehydrogenase-like predicted oxidoreductase